MCQIEDYYVRRNYCESFTGKIFSLLIIMLPLSNITLYFFLRLCFSKLNFLMVMHTLNVFTRISYCRKELLGVAKYSGLTSWFQNVFWCAFLDVYFQLFSSWINSSFFLSLKNIFFGFLLSLKNIFAFYYLISGQ